MLERLFRTRPAVSAGRALYESVVAQSRAPALYADLAVPDTVEGRFEAYSLHVVLLLDRLRAADAQGRDDAREVSQALFDTYVKALDHALREMGVGDLSVGKKMRRLGEAFYGRGKSYEAAFAALPDEAPLQALIGRTVYAGVEAPPVERLAAYVLAERAALATLPLEPLLAGEVAWKPL
ncbi:MAG: ubiquinol-cytochrome C reductase [Proteobacteria bacterium]|nr:ubiquinol-cytochrome C reductase [Pseudomonadota bacterium]